LLNKYDLDAGITMVCSQVQFSAIFGRYKKFFIHKNHFKNCPVRGQKSSQPFFRAKTSAI